MNPPQHPWSPQQPYGVQQPGPPSSGPGWWLVPLTCVLAVVLGTSGGVVGSWLHSTATSAEAAPERPDWFVRAPEVPSSAPSVSPTVPPAPTGAPLPRRNGSVTAVAAQLSPSTVQILAFADSDDAEPGSTGSGFVLDSTGNVVTNNHVVADTVDGGRLQVVDQVGNVLDAELVGRSAVYDIAVVRLTSRHALPPATLGDSVEVQVGQPVVAIGAPLGLAQTVTSGIVSALKRPVSTGASNDQTSFISAIQTDAAINPGNSGGPLVNLRGQVVGVNTAIATTGGSGSEMGSIGVGFAIPAAQVRRTADQILTTGRAQFPVIGASVRPVRATFDGAEITAVESDGPARAAGLRVGDKVTAVAGEKVRDGVAMIVAIRTHQPGDTVRLERVRGGRTDSLEVTLAARTG